MFRKAMFSLTAALGLAASSQAQQMIYDPATGRWVANSATRIDSVDGFGRINTSGTTVHSSATDPYRESSRYNGSMRRVNRPKFDAYGNIVGYEVGVEWTNSVTGETHGDTKVVTNNGLNVNNLGPSYPPAYPPTFPGGGMNQQTVIKSTGPMGGFNTQSNIYSGPTGGFSGGQHVQHQFRSAPPGGVNVQGNVYSRNPSMGGAGASFGRPMGGGSMSLPSRTGGMSGTSGGFRGNSSGPRR
jgi:hypothetical protein